MATITEPSSCDRKPDIDAAPIPKLENGDRLTRPEFERRYEAMPELKKAELIEGVVYMPSPVRLSRHGEPHIDLSTWLRIYSISTAGVRASLENSIRMDLDNEPQPDVCLFIDPARGGQARISQDDYLEGAPELVAEVASSSASYDLHVKLHVYRRSGVREYLVWRVLDGQIDWFMLREGQYEPLAPGSDSLLRSTVFPGLWLDPAALLRGDLTSVLAVLDQGVHSLEHAEFVARLAKTNTEPSRPEQERPTAQ
jgi:Uma2 family endonuclease